ncbi:hypothetical protein [Candidatus Paracaedibacter symbiosus]|uniref:hypothetical protein n=1 Tax=Candidatus Paracaedibacter symbiosus TaxID=244582 RepID=UPI000509B7CF|nr:hypothetical protein [Candidatus Paracaedibacter symbiosus]
MKNLLKLALMASLFTVSTAQADDKQDGSEAVTRFEGVKKVFAEKGIGAIAFLNGTGTLGSETGKGRENENIGLEAGVDNYNDADAPLVCIGADDTYIVHTGKQTLVGQSAVEGTAIWYDDEGKKIVPAARGALHTGTKPEGMTHIDYVQNSRTINPREGKPDANSDALLIADGRFIKGLPEGAFCATRMENYEPRDNSDRDRLVAEDKGEGKIGHDVDTKKGDKHHGKKHHHKHHAKKHDAKAVEATKDASKAAGDAKEAEKAAADAKEATKK